MASACQSVSFSRQLGVSHDPSPLDELALHQLRESLRRAALHVRTLLFDELNEPAVAKNLIEAVVQLVDDRFRGSRRSEEGIPLGHVDTMDTCFLQSGDIRQARRPFGTGYRQRAQPSCLDVWVSGEQAREHDLRLP